MAPEQSLDPSPHLVQLQTALLEWFGAQRRSLPWRDLDDPYRVLVSEIMLQQTQVSRVVPLYTAFLDRFPDVAALAAAPAGDVVAAWKGLGYNRRAVGLHRAAQAVMRDHGGVVPCALEELEALPGVGPYTARAVRAFAFGMDDAPVDTNVTRVLTRAVAGAPLKGAALRRAADGAVPTGRGRDWSAALMDLGATVCTARRPRCDACPVRHVCAYAGSGGEDPAAGRRPAAQAFAGSNRYHRGRLLDAVREGPVPRGTIAAAAQTTSATRAEQLAADLVADGLAQWDGHRLRLPG